MIDSMRQRGFTLLEVLVALAILGAGAAMAYAAMGAGVRLNARALTHEAALRLAQAKLDEVLAHPEFALADDDRSDEYAGQSFGFRLSARPAAWMAPRTFEQVREHLNFDLEEVRVEVYWGDGAQRQSHEVRTLRYRPRPSTRSTAAAPPRGPASAPASGLGATIGGAR